jgi:alkylation response protein AidB-like acyl-CoA dehydrogenase
LYPQTTAEPIDGGWRINGRKIFGTLSPVADRFVLAVKVIGDPEHPLNGNAFVGRDAPGLTIFDNWDALGMRASGSNDLMLEDVEVGVDQVIAGAEWGKLETTDVTSLFAGNTVVIAANLGIAEAAHDEVVRMLQTRRKVPDTNVLAHRPAIQHGVAEMEIDLFGMRAALERITRLADDEVTARGAFEVELADLHHLMKELQCARSIVNRKAIEVVDAAMTLSGGAGFLTSNILSRLYRDVRAGPFVQPFSPNEAFEYIGRVALGLDPLV